MKAPDEQGQCKKMF